MKDYVKASEIQEYVYCKRAWWLTLHHRLPVTQQMKAGTLAHDRLAQSVDRFTTRKMIIVIVVEIAALLFFVYVLLRLIMEL